MFNKNHYVFIAKSLKDSKPMPFNWFNMEVWDKVVYTIAHDLSDDNPYFDEARFLRQCNTILTVESKKVSSE